MLKHPQHLAPSRPFLKWLGGKGRLLPTLLPLLPPGSRLIEPFVGAGAVFLGSSYPAAILGDANPDLAAVWVAIKERPREFVARASELFSDGNRSPEAYLRIRSEYNEAVDRFERAVRFMYLNKFGFNGSTVSTGEVSSTCPTRIPRCCLDFRSTKWRSPPKS